MLLDSANPCINTLCCQLLIGSCEPIVHLSDAPPCLSVMTSLLHHISLHPFVLKMLYPLLYFSHQVAVNSGGKHCLALSAEGEVYSWGEGDDGKLGHGNRRYNLVFSTT